MDIESRVNLIKSIGKENIENLLTNKRGICL